MAYYAALTPLLQLLEDIILNGRYPYFLLGKHPVMESIHKNFTLLEESLAGYSSKGDEANDHVEGRIRDVAHQAQDVIELEIFNQINEPERSEKCVKDLQVMNQVSEQESSIIKKRNFYNSCFSCIMELHRKNKSSEKYVETLPVVSPCIEELPKVKKYVEELETEELPKVKKYVEELETVNQEINSILEEMKLVKERQTNEDSKLDWESSDTNATKQVPSNTSIVVGLDDDLITIKGQLCGQSSRLEVIAIVGTGGIGKTTLARHTYEDALVVYRFDYRAWVVVTQDFNVNQFLQTISKSLGVRTHVGLLEKDEGALKEGIYKHLKGRRYLIVIDDIWSTQVWDDVKHIFPNDNNGSRIMLTTRLLDVAEYASTTGFTHKMQFLNNDQSWNLLQEKVFGREHCPSELEGLGKSIARYCSGLPLAIVVIAGVLSTTKTLYAWEKIAAHVREILSDRDERLCKILSLSYNHLSHQLKACFLYLGSFPEDHVINVSNLIKVWVAEGFLKSTDEDKILEDVAVECLMDLVKRNLVLVTKKRYNSQPKFCVLHDLLRDFCRERALHEHFFHAKHDNGDLYPKANKKVRHLNWYRISRYGSLHKVKMGKLLRSIHLCGERYISVSECFECADFKLVRVFEDFGREGYGYIPDVLFQMFNLRYLGFGPWTRIWSFPASLMFQNLQSLIVQRPNSSRMMLPPQIWKMTLLRHLVVPRMFLPSIPRDVDKLEYLQTLMSISNFRLTNEAIEMIPNLRKLRCYYTLYIDELNLFHLFRLEELIIQMTVVRTEYLLGKINFPLNLRKLSLEGCQIQWKNLTCVGSLPHLQVLRLRRESFVGEEWEPNEGEFVCLKILLLEGLYLKYWRANETHFPCLEHLEIRRCPILEMIPLEIGEIPTLKAIKVLEYGNDIGDSAIRIREEQRKQGNDDLQVYHDRITRTHTIEKEMMKNEDEEMMKKEREIREARERK